VCWATLPVDPGLQEYLHTRRVSENWKNTGIRFVGGGGFMLRPWYRRGNTQCPNAHLEDNGSREMGELPGAERSHALATGAERTHHATTKMSNEAKHALGQRRSCRGMAFWKLIRTAEQSHRDR
jgi:hypothetical protein